MATTPTTNSWSNKKKAIIAIAIAIAAPFEGLRQVAYYDPPGILTVCYGTTTNVVKNKVYSIEECKALLQKDMSDTVDAVMKCTDKLNLSVDTTAAFSDGGYNFGVSVICDPNKSTLAKKLVAGDVVGACNELTKWDKARIGGKLVSLPGLTKRRAAERALCLKGIV